MIYEISDVEKQLEDEITAMIYGGHPMLTIIKTNDDYASNVYINAKVKRGTDLGFSVNVVDVTNRVDPIDDIKSYCSFSDGVIVQLPVCEKLKSIKDDMLNAVYRNKDVDGLGRHTAEMLWETGTATFLPCTAKAICDVIDHKFPKGIRGKTVVIINRSNLIGKPLVHMMLARDATVTVCHSQTSSLALHVRRADIVITATGEKDLINEDMFVKNAFVVDAGICRDENGKVHGDCNDRVKDLKFVSVTPVPNGIGRLTVLNLLYNTAKSYRMFRRIK